MTACSRSARQTGVGKVEGESAARRHMLSQDARGGKGRRLDLHYYPGPNS